MNAHANPVKRNFAFVALMGAFVVCCLMSLPIQAQTLIDFESIAPGPNEIDNEFAALGVTFKLVSTTNVSIPFDGRSAPIIVGTGTASLTALLHGSGRRWNSPFPKR